MSASAAHTFGKKERICSRKLIDKLFNEGGSRAMAAFPVRLVYTRCPREAGQPAVQMLVSVPKKCFKWAVKRNRVKRQVREAFRLNKQIVYNSLPADSDTTLLLAFIWIDNQLYDTAVVEQKVVNLMQRLAEKAMRQGQHRLSAAHQQGSWQGDTQSPLASVHAADAAPLADKVMDAADSSTVADPSNP